MLEIGKVKAKASRTNRGRAASFLLFVVLIASCRTAKIYQVGDSPLGGDGGFPLADVERTIREAAERKGWVVEREEAGVLRAEYVQRRHRAVVAISFTQATFRIDYVDSMRLKYDGASIHVVYNEWVRGLEQAIIRESSLSLVR